MRLGYANVDAMLESMPSTMFTEWMAFFKIFKIDEDTELRDDRRTAIIAAATTNAMRVRNPVSPEAFMPKWDGEPPPTRVTVQDPEAIRRGLIGLARKNKPAKPSGDDEAEVDDVRVGTKSVIRRAFDGRKGIRQRKRESAEGSG